MGDDVESGLDLDIWARGRDAAQAGRITERMLEGAYPNIEIRTNTDRDKIKLICTEHLEPNHYGQQVWRIDGHHVFFISTEDRDLCRGLLYLY